MRDRDRELFMRALGNELDGASLREFEQRLAEDAELCREWEDMQRAQGLLTTIGEPKFRPFFATRVMHRLKARQSEGALDDLTGGLTWVFRPLVPLAVAVCVALAVSNWNSREMVGQEASFLEVSLAILPPSVESAEILSM